MRVVLGADQYPEYINGAATFTARLAAGLAGRGHTVDLLWPSAEGPPRSDVVDGVRVHRLTSLGLPGRPRMQVCSPWAAPREIASVLEMARPDVTHVQSHLTLGRTLLRASRDAGVPVLATNHFMPENLLHHVPVVRRFPALAARVAWWDLERVFRDADRLSAPTPRAVALLGAATDLPAATAISCGIDLAGYGRSAPAAGPPTVLFVGRLEQEKHVDELIDAFARVPARYGARLEIVGMGSLRGRWETLAAGLGLGDAVVFSGAVSDAELVEAYARAAVFAMPGTAELQSLATLEAMAAGRPVVAADAMALPHLVRDGGNGFLYPPGDVPALARRLTSLLAEPALRSRMGAASRLVAEQHSLSATLRAFEDCYAGLLADRAEAAAAHAPEQALALVS